MTQLLVVTRSYPNIFIVGGPTSNAAKIFINAYYFTAFSMILYGWLLKGISLIATYYYLAKGFCIEYTVPNMP